MVVANPFYIILFSILVYSFPFSHVVLHHCMRREAAVMLISASAL